MTYVVADPFLRFWFRYVEPAWSRLESRQIASVAADIRRTFPHHVGEVWEDLARQSVAHLTAFGHRWRPASRWWGAGLDRQPMEIDVVAESEDGGALLVGEARWSRTADDARVAGELRHKVARFPLARGRTVHLATWAPKPIGGRHADVRVFTPANVLKVLR